MCKAYGRAAEDLGLTHRHLEGNQYPFAKVPYGKGRTCETKEADETVVSKALLYLSNPRLKILKTCLLYEFRGIYSELPSDEVDHYSKGERVIHPDYGEPLSESEILVCFTPGDSLLQRDSE